MQIAPRVAWQSFAGQVVLVDLDNGRALGLNDTASFLWTLVGAAEPPELVQALCREFAVEAEVARRDVEAFLRMLDDRGFLLP